VELPTLLPTPDDISRRAVARRASEVLRPVGALARLDAIATWLAAWQRTPRPRVERPAALVFAGDHGVVSHGVSAYDGSITAEMVRALRAGSATASVMARELDVHLEVVDVGAGAPTGDIVTEDALSPERFAECFSAGRDAVSALHDQAGERSIDADLVVLGEMGIGNTTAAAAVATTLFGLRAEDWTGRGTGVDDVTYRRKVAAVEAARNRAAGSGPLETLRKVGGTELAAIAGAVLEARLRSLPVVLDGFVVTASVAALEWERPGMLDHCIAGHLSPEPGHRLLLEKLAKDPLLDLGLRLGEGSGALAGIPLIRLAAACVTDVATFSEWGLRRGE
jgi:nicotinate-nucleotide--dimethylbenzimidazole phosphoribosyltransferase